MALSGSFQTQGSYEGRKFVFSWTASQSVSENTSTISWKLEATGGQSGNYWYYDGPITVTFTPSGGSAETLYHTSSRTKRYKGTITTGTKAIPHLSDGTMSFTVRVQGAVYYDAVNEDASASFTLDPIARATTPVIRVNGSEVTSVEFGTEVTIDLSSRAVSSFTHTLTYYFNQDIAQIGTGIGTSTSWTPAASMADQIKTAESGVCAIVCQTYNGQTLIGERIVNLTLVCPASWKPTISSISLSPTNVRTGDLAGAYLQLVDGVIVSVTAAHAGHADIVSYTVTADGKTYTSDTGVIPTEVFASSGTKGITVAVTDSRGRTVIDSTSSVTVLAYALPTNVVTVRRTDSSGAASETGDYMVVSVQSAVTSIQSGGTELNRRTVTVKHKKQSAGSWTTVSLVSSSATVSDTDSTAAIAVPNDETCAVEITVSDTLSETKRTTNLSVGYCTVDFLAGGRGIAFGNTAKREGFECDMPARFGQDVQLGISIFNLTATGRTAATITWTVNSDGSVSASGTAGSSNNEYILGTFQALAGHTYVLKGCPEGGSSTLYRLYAKVNNTNFFDYGSGVTFTSPNDETVNIRGWCYKNKTVNLVFRPQIYDTAIYTPSLKTVLNKAEAGDAAISATRAQQALARKRFTTQTGTFSLSDFAVSDTNSGVYLVLLRDYTVNTPRHSMYLVSFIDGANVGCSQVFSDGGPTLAFSGLTGTVTFGETIGGMMSVVGGPIL